MKILPSDALAPVGSYLISGKVETKELKSLAANQDQSKHENQGNSKTN
jgi:hypothetical protein